LEGCAGEEKPKANRLTAFPPSFPESQAWRGNQGFFLRVYGLLLRAGAYSAHQSFQLSNMGQDKLHV
ncbi:MAG: hypothetical protein JZU67_05610, partial [Burkholderiaceae bacterium]|nr:hypothetical protein [Burkholderiaceae bacterium]